MAGAFQEDAFQEDAFQIAVAVPPVEVPDLPSEVLGRAFQFRARFSFGTVRITQTAPSFTQSLAVRVTDDELVLMLI